MKDKIYCLLLLFLLIFMLNPLPKVLASGQSGEEEQLLLQFPVMSDIHIGEEVQKERFINALKDFRAIAPNYQAIAMVGDITNHGAVREYEDFNKLLNSNMNEGAEKIITMGNHEYFEGFSSKTGLDKYLYMKRFTSMTGMPGDGATIYYDKWIEGYHFITLGGEGFTAPDDDDYANITEAQYSWLKRTLPKSADPAKPIFVFLHQPIDHTVYGSDDWGAGFDDTKLLDLLNQYPQVILFSGHSHYILNHPRTIYQDGFTMVNTGAVAYTYSDSGSLSFSQGLLVNVYADRVEIKAREFTNHTWIQTFSVKTPFQKAYGDEQKPFFNRGTSAKVEQNESGDSVSLSWDAAFDNTLIDKYVIKNNGKVIYTKYREFWKNSDPESKEFAKLVNLAPDTEYHLSIYAVDAWNNQSMNSLNLTFTTSKLNGWRWEDEKWRFYKEGERVTGWQEIEGKRYLFLSDTSMFTGWYTDGNNKYYLNTNGAMQTGWKEINGNYYYFSSEGIEKIGWLQDQGKWYYLKSNGLQTGWLLDSNSWYFLNSGGVMETGWILVAGKWYYLDTSGAMKTGWAEVNNRWYYLDKDGVMKTGWTEINKKWYYLDKSGIMMTGWTEISKKWYFLDKSGIMKTGWLLSGDKWYYLQVDGTMKSGWLNENSKWYFLKDDGSMAQNTIIQGYIFGNDGVWIN